MPYRFETVDVFTTQRFGGNPLAVFLDAEGMDTAEMQAIAGEMNLSETTFVLPPEDRANTARVRIFNRTHEMPFAGHPSIGTAWVLANHGRVTDGEARLEVPAGLVRVAMAADGTGGRLTAPQALKRGPELDPAAAAACAGLAESDIRTQAHLPVQISAGVDFVAAEVSREALGRALPDLAAFRRALIPWMEGRLSLFLYARDGAEIRARMFAPLAGTWEDPATGSANSALAALLLSLDGGDAGQWNVQQGVEMGRPSLLELSAVRTAQGYIGSVGGSCVPVFRGEYG